MARKILVKLIMELRAAGMSQTSIAKSRHMSKTSVSEVFGIAQERKISYEDIRDKTPEESYEIFYPDKQDYSHLFTLPDYAYIHKELSKTGVTLKLLWKEYGDKSEDSGNLSVGYTKFCTGYAEFTNANSLTNHLLHKPGVSAEVDWGGSKMSIVDRSTGEIIPIYLFVATLPYSQYSFVEPCLNMKEDTWLRCHVHMYEFFGGTAVRIICDNLKTGVIRHPHEGDIILNGAYEALGSHYSVAIMPTGVRKPKQKASVEGTVGKIATAIIAKLRNEVFYSLDELKVGIRKALKEFNDGHFQKRPSSRSEIFLLEEKPCLRELPAIPYEIAQWYYGRKVNLDCHIAFEKNRYSCPYQYVGKTVDIKATDSLVEIYYNDQRMTVHRRFPEYLANQWSTHQEDMPDHFHQSEWDDQRIQSWAHSIGNCTSEVIERIFGSVKIKEQGYNSCLSVLRLSKTHSKERLEVACEMALAKIRSPRYRHVKAILSANQDITYKQNKHPVQQDANGGYVRGSVYYGGGRHDS